MGRIFIVLASALLFLIGCAPRTDMTSFVDPAYRSGRNFSSVVVFAVGVGLEEKQIVETAVVEQFSAYKVRAFRGIDVIPPTREVTNQQWADKIVSSGVDTVLIISAGGKDVTETYVPPTYFPGTTTGTAQTFGNTTYLNVYQSPGYTTGGYTISKPFAVYSATLIDVASGQTVWKADATSRGNAFATYNDLGLSVANETVAKLIADSLF